MAILTRGQFASIAQAKAGTRGLRGFVSENRIFFKATSITSIFLSHSHTDKDVIEQAKIFFENLGISVYVDWADKTMPESTSGVTAQKIKSQIVTGNDKFILLATDNAIASKWCNWEVGIADSFKLSSKKMALLPLADNRGTWGGNEYLQIYPRIERGTVDSNEYWVWYPDGSLESISTWLNRK
ncbi:MAG TPA: toll/interleukin-1 receptor domain-containing protein [Cyclobacteriaceae bacterium]|nr:toll/interleukin-1 receptor domain-containing protein [Cyclobacteriaceae bacterium]HMV09411.1 toll/interleukin-1 receptor domain-containing protein [Cyclobacteriaceae bacterium]HMX02432.1 toll/interleukin-1 receptor domain-containing protein [Cyclobacteriaceae bacterium]HMX51080.1 toll/interleukin-1 receptor domain-containing protein [Cyclobacteriaceae bacterium]HMY91742.1 toll/interleukin-1 receptor domain-containing protein [Cyclobacteriaceae bacterium]